MYDATIGARRYVFADLKTLLAKATPAALGRRAGRRRGRRRARSASPRRWRWPTCRCARFLDEPVIPYENDEVTRLIVDSHDAAAFAPVAHLTVGELPRLAAVATQPTTAALTRARARPDAGDGRRRVASSCAIQDLMLVARKCRVVTRFRNTIGLPGRLSMRLQPNHPTDDPRGIAAVDARRPAATAAATR